MTPDRRDEQTAGAAIVLRWVPREPPLPPTVAVADGAEAAALFAQLRRRQDALLRELRGVARRSTTAPLIAVWGPSDHLPWVDGIRYFGETSAAPGVFLPATLRPDGPIDLWAKALRRLVPHGPLVWDQERVVPLAEARPLSRASLEAWAAP